MILNCKEYSGLCACGREHKTETECCIIEAGCMAKANDYIQENGLSGISVAIYDENTYKATNRLHPKADFEIILPPQNLHADNHGVAKALAQLPPKCDYLIAVGSGTVHDITRYCAYQKGIPFVSCPTAASVDGFCSSVAAMTWDGFKKTFTATAPKLVIADLNIIAKAPMFLTNSGFGDMIGKFIALADWKIGHLLTGEYFCPTIHNMTLEATQAVLQSVESIKKGNVEAFEKLTYGLLMSGLAMQLLGYSRCASGAEHHISHFIEMQPAVLGVSSAALHGEKVGVGTLIASKQYHKIKTAKNIVWKDPEKIEPNCIKSVFGEDLSSAIITENAKDCMDEITAQKITENFEEICTVIETVPTYEELIQKYRLLGVKSTLEEIEVPPEKLPLLLRYSPLVRNRLTLMRLCRAIFSNESDWMIETL